MAGFDNNFNDELRQRLSIVDVVGKRVPLAKKGKDFWGCCPFHNEKTPSFKVNEEMGRYYCFGCGEKGDIISFTMKTQNMQYGEAIRELATMAGLKVPEFKPKDPEVQKREQTYFDIMESATQTFQKKLYEADGAHALSYLRGRGFDDDTIKKYRIGYAPNNNTLAHKFASVRLPLVLGTGLIRESTRGGAPYDFFRNRLMFPITNPAGQVIAFSGRSLDGSEPKYINTSDTEFFHKRQTVFGLSYARNSIHSANRSILVEGQIDAIKMQINGFGETVAPLGTALTAEHLQILCKLNRNITFCFDGDKAGIKAAARAADIVLPLIRPESDIRFAFVAGGKDPDDILKKPGGTTQMKSIIDNAIGLVDYIWKLANDGFVISTPGGRANAEKYIADSIAKIADPKLRDEYRHEYDSRKFNQWHKWKKTTVAKSMPVPKISGLESQTLSQIATQHPGLIEKYSEFLIKAGFNLSGDENAPTHMISSDTAEKFIVLLKIKHYLKTLMDEKTELTASAMSGDESATARIREIDSEISKTHEKIALLQED